MRSGSGNHSGLPRLPRSSSAPGLNSRPTSQLAARTLPGALRRGPGSWGFQPVSQDSRDVARALRGDQRPKTAQLQTASLEPQRDKPEQASSICELTAHRVSIPGAPTDRAIGRPQKVCFFKDKLVCSGRGPLADEASTSVDFANICHAELDGKARCLKLRIRPVADGIPQRLPGDRTHSVMSPSYLQMEFEESELHTLQSLIWPLLLQSVFAERNVGSRAKFNGPLRGPSLVWSHA